MTTTDTALSPTAVAAYIEACLTVADEEQEHASNYLGGSIGLDVEYDGTMRMFLPNGQVAFISISVEG
jgi:hypothetical protein